MKEIVLVLLSTVFVTGISAQTIPEKLEKYISKASKGRHFNGTVLVMQQGKPLLYKGMGYKNTEQKTLNDTGTIYRIGSLSKPFTAMLVLRLHEEKKLDIGDKLSKYIPDYPDGDAITIEQLLTHSTRITDYLNVKAIQELPDSAPPIAMEKLIAYFKNEPSNVKGNEKFTYSNSNYILLAYVIEKATGQKFEHVMRQYFFQPLQMDHSGFAFKNLPDTNKATGYGNIYKQPAAIEDFDSTYAPGCGSMYTSASDLYKFYAALCNGTVISNAMRENAFSARHWKYGYGWFSYTLYGKRCISHAGGVPGFYANMQFFPDDNVCIILLSNSNDGFIETDKLAAIVFGKKFERSGL